MTKCLVKRTNVIKISSKTSQTRKTPNLEKKSNVPFQFRIFGTNKGFCELFRGSKFQLLKKRNPKLSPLSLEFSDLSLSRPPHTPPIHHQDHNPITTHEPHTKYTQTNTTTNTPNTTILTHPHTLPLPTPRLTHHHIPTTGKVGSFFFTFSFSFFQLACFLVPLLLLHCVIVVYIDLLRLLVCL